MIRLSRERRRTRCGVWPVEVNQVAGPTPLAAPAAPTQSGGELAAGLAAGDRSALVHLAEAWGPRIYRYLASRLADRELVRDLTQETLTRAVDAIRRGTRPRDLKAWLFRIATNLLRDELRSGYRNRVVLTEVPEHGAGEDTEQKALDQMRQEAVRQAVLGLPPDLQEVLTLRFYEGFSVDEVAAITGLPVGTVKSRLYRAYRRLEEQLAPWRHQPRQGGNADGR